MLGPPCPGDVFIIHLGGEKVVGPTELLPETCNCLRAKQRQTGNNYLLSLSPYKEPGSFVKSIVQSIEGTRNRKGFF